MYITEAIRKGCMLVVSNNDKARELKALYKYEAIMSYRSLDKYDGLRQAVWIDDDVPVDKFDLGRVESNTFGQVYYGNSNENEYEQTLDNIDELIKGQNKTIDAAIKLRIFSSHIQKFLQDLEQANKGLGLTDTIDQLVQLHKQFDDAAMEYGPYTKEVYASAVLEPFFKVSDSDGKS